MYKCTECGMEYEIKPDYCDCGNDEFVITVEEKTVEIKEPEKESQKVIIENKEPVRQEDIYRPNFLLPKVDPISLGIFSVCLILAIIVIIYPIKSKVIYETATNDTPISVKNIPAIDKFWNNTVPVTIQKQTLQPVPEPVAVKVVTPVKQVVKPTIKPVQTQKSTPKQTTVKLQKNSAISTVEQAKKAEEAKKKAEAEARAKAEENARKLAEVHKQAADLQQAMSDKMEYANYKTNLRNTIGRKIDFTRVIGDGDCVISFKIDPSGRLINGAFVKQSSNITLNDAVYKAFMNSRNFSAPPAGYKNETLRLNVKFYNGNFEISLN